MDALRNVGRTFGTVSRNRSLRRVLVGFLAFNAVEYAVWIAVILYAYRRGGPTTAGLVLIAQLLPAAVVAPFGSVMGDRLRRDHALAAGYAAQGAATLACGLALAFAPAFVAYAAAAVSSSTMTFTRPVHNALLPELAGTPEELTAANSLSSTAEALGILLGPAINSLLVAVSGPALVVIVFGTVSLAAASITRHLELHEGGEAHHPEARPGRILRSTAEGLHELRRDRQAGILTITGAAQFVVLGMLDVFYAMLAIDVLARGEELAGLLAAVVGIGGVLGAAATAALVGRRRLTTPIEIALMLMGAAVAAIALVGEVAPVVAMLLLAGAGRSFFDVATRTLLQRTVRDDILARVFGLQEGLAMLGLALGSVAAPFFVAVVGVRGAFVAAGALPPFIGAVVVASLRSLDRRATLPDPERVGLLRQLALFRPLAQPALERLAAKLVPIRVGAGETVIRQGDAGEHFYVIADGGADVRVGDRHLATLGAGEYFGEIALLRDVPRTATVTAVAPTRLFSLDRAAFLAVVGGSRPSADEADREIERRLASHDEE